MFFVDCHHLLHRSSLDNDLSAYNQVGTKPFFEPDLDGTGIGESKTAIDPRFSNLNSEVFSLSVSSRLCAHIVSFSRRNEAARYI